MGIGGINIDVTEIHQREQELIVAKTEAENAAKQAKAADKSKSRFIANMSHEIRTPMNGVLGMADLLSRTPLTHEQGEFVETLKESGQNLLNLLNDILDLSKIEAGRVELEDQNFSISELLKSTNTFWGHAAQDKGLAFSILNSVSENDVICGDRNRLRQIINNLLGNAIKFTAEGKIEVRATEEATTENSVKLRFEVHDSGIGISEEKRETVFSPFTQADSSTTRQYGGTGLGLTICQDLVGILGGEIGVESSPGNGAIFWFTISAKKGDPKKVRSNFTNEFPAPTQPATDNDRTLRLLIAEDNFLNQRIISWMLAPLNCQFDIVSNGLEAVAAINRSTYDLILMDVQMPEMDGVEATKQIRTLAGPDGQIPIIAMTANAMQGDREKFLEAGMTDYVSKPVDQRELLGTIARRATGSMPVIDVENIEDVLPAEVDKVSKPDTGRNLNKLMGELNDRLDGTDG